MEDGSCATVLFLIFIKMKKDGFLKKDKQKSKKHTNKREKKKGQKEERKE